MNAMPGAAPALPSRRGLAALTLPWLLLAGMAHGQQRPLTGSMLAPQAPSATAPATAPEVAQPYANTGVAAETSSVAMEPAATDRRGRSEIGDTTRQLLRMQAEGRYAGKALPILGDQGAASYQRYLKSFEHEIPEFFEANVRKEVSGDDSGG